MQINAAPCLFRSHVTSGAGTPVALQTSSAREPSNTCTSLFWSIVEKRGGTEKYKSYIFFQYIKFFGQDMFLCAALKYDFNKDFAMYP